MVRVCYSGHRKAVARPPCEIIRGSIKHSFSASCCNEPRKRDTNNEKVCDRLFHRYCSFPWILLSLIVWPKIKAKTYDRQCFLGFRSAGRPRGASTGNRLLGKRVYPHQHGTQPGPGWGTAGARPKGRLPFLLLTTFSQYSNATGASWSPSSTAPQSTPTSSSSPPEAVSRFGPLPIHPFCFALDQLPSTRSLVEITCRKR